MRNLIHIIFIIFCIIISNQKPASAFVGVALLADQIIYDPKSKLLTATGNVRILYQGQALSTEKLLYNQATGEIILPQSFQLVGQDGTVIYGSKSSLNNSTKKALITGAQILINEQFQISAEQFKREQNRYKIMTKVVASTCYICSQTSIPFWQIRSKLIIHDEIEKRIYFEDPILRLLGIPVLYLPYLSIPDPSIKRASGLLVPRFSYSKKLGSRIELPYYTVFNDHADATITPSISTQKSLILKGEYRQSFINGKININGAIGIIDPLHSQIKNRSFIKADATFGLPKDTQLSFGIHLASDKKFKADYNLGNEDRLKNFITFERTRPSSYMSLGASMIQSLRTNEVDDEIPLVFPEIYFRKNPFTSKKFGKISYTLQTVTLLRTEGRKFSRLGGKLDWHKNWRSHNGILYKGEISLTANNYVQSHQNNSQETNYQSLTPTAAISLRYPLSKTDAMGAIHVIEPIAQLVWSRNKARKNPNEDSLQVEFEDSNLFSSNRFFGFDRHERGLRANIGLRYLRYDPNGWEIGATIGRVYRQKNLNQFSTSVATGLEGKVSDYVASFSLRFPNKFQLSSKLLLNSKGKVSKNETQLQAQYKKINLSTSYVLLDTGTVLGHNKRQHEVSFKTQYQHNDNWRFNAEWRQNIEKSNLIEANFGVQYENECTKIVFSLSLQDNEFGRLERNYGLKISLNGIGARTNKQKFARKCGN